MKIFGHPVHMMLIHFPSALFPMDLVCSMLNRSTGNAAFLSASFCALCGGVLLGWIAMVAGSMDLLKVVDRNPGAVKKALIHGGINSCVVIAYTVIGYSEYKHYPYLQEDSKSMLILKALVIGLMIIGNFAGGSLILKHKVAVETTDESREPC